MSWELLTSHFIDINTEAQSNELIQNDTEVQAETGFKHQQSDHHIFLFTQSYSDTQIGICFSDPRRKAREMFPIYRLAGKQSIDAESCIIKRLD